MDQKPGGNVCPREKSSVMHNARTTHNDIKVLNFVKEIGFSDNIKPELEIKEDQKPDKLHLEYIKSENVVVHN